MSIACRSAQVIIPNYNGESLLQSYLTHTIRACGADQITVVDDASTDGSVALLRQRFPGVRMIERTDNGGFAKSANDGIRATQGEFVLLLNNDVEVTPEFLDTILPAFDDESVFSVSPRILLPSLGDIDEGCKTAYWRHGFLYTGQRQGVTDVVPILYATACAAVYRRAMLEDLGGFDEAYSPFYWEDVDLGYRAWKRGWRSLYHPGATVYHQHSASISKLDANLTGRIRARNSLLFLWRNLEDADLLSSHRQWLPLVLLRRLISGDTAFLLGWKEARDRRSEALAAVDQDSKCRRLSDKEIMAMTGIDS